MSENFIDINPSVTVYKLLECYPELEEVLISLAPPFKKLRNPLLRRSITKVATIKHIAAVGKIPLNTLIETLRKEVGQELSSESYNEEDYFTSQPDWLNEDKIVLKVNDDTVKDKDKMTVTLLLKEAVNCNSGDIIELQTTFLPAPGIDTMRAKGYMVWPKKESDEIIKTYFMKCD